MDGKDFLDLFVCPVCKIKVVYEQENSHLKCPQCNRRFPIIDGIVDAFVPIEGLKTSSIDLPEWYEHWGGSSLEAKVIGCAEILPLI